ncbi:MAG: FtsQ-type POTRA domain-containing protein [Treponema sp.]|nr:FtsQ-type POTRA domain-containing protein [Treponema sp.]
MTSDYLYAAAEDVDTGTEFAVTEPKSFGSSAEVPGKLEKSLKKLFVVAGIIFISELVWLFGVSPFIPFSTVEVQGFAGLEREEVLKFAGIDESSSFVSTNVKGIREKLSNHILVESAAVFKRFPDKISIFLYPREAAAVVLANIGSRQVPLYIDRHGVFFKIGKVGSNDMSGIPILSGFENPQLNMRLPAALVPLAKSLSEFASDSPELLSVISEIHVERKTWDGFDLVLYPVHSSIKVRVENNLTDDMLRYMLLVLNVFEKSPSKPEEIDFRSGMGSYKIKGQSL